jgi:hypothetical protein
VTEKSDKQKHGVIRTTAVLVVVALVFYVGFIMIGVVNS